MSYPRGLIRYSTQNAMTQGWSGAQVLRRVFRPRVLVYSAILLGVTAALLASLALRSPFRVDIDRDRASLARIVSGGKIENVYRLQVMNATESTQSYRIAATGLPGLKLMSEAAVSVNATESRSVPVTLQLPYEAAKAGSHEIHFEVQAIDSPGRVIEKSIFLVPR